MPVYVGEGRQAVRILTLDLGTGALKACLWKEARLVACRTAALTTRLQGEIAEQDPRDWWEQTVRLVGELLAAHPDYADVDCIGVTGHMHALVPTDAGGEPLAAAAVVPDRRARAACRDLDDEFGASRILRWTGGRLHATTALAKARHFARAEDRAWTEARWLLPPKDHLRMRLTGEAASDPIDAAGTMLWDIQQGRWHEGLAEFAGCRLSQLPPVLATVSLAGRLRPEAASVLGLRAGTPVATGGGDDIEVFGAGVMRPGDLFEHLGTTGSIYVATDGPIIDPAARVETYPDVLPGRWLMGGSTSAAGLAQRWILALTGQENDWAEADALYQRMAAESRPSEVTFLPYLAGERAPLWDIDRAGALLGLRAHHTAKDAIQAVVEGVLFSLRSVLQVLDELGVATAEGKVHTAGPFGDGEVLGQVRANVYCREVVRLGDGEAGTSLAAMALASCAVTGEDPYEMMSRLLIPRWSYRPRDEACKAYDVAYRRYLRAMDLLCEFDQEERAEP